MQLLRNKKITEFESTGIADNQIEVEESIVEAPVVEESVETEIEVDVNDTEYRLQTVPDDPSGYNISDEVIGAENFDQNRYDSFADVAHAQKLTQRQFEKAISWWNSNISKYADGGFGQDFTDAFMGFAGRNNFTSGQVNGLQKWFVDFNKKQDEQITQIREFALKSSGDSGSEKKSSDDFASQKQQSLQDKRDNNGRNHSP